MFAYATMRVYISSSGCMRPPPPGSIPYEDLGVTPCGTRDGIRTGLHAQVYPDSLRQVEVDGQSCCFAFDTAMCLDDTCNVSFDTTFVLSAPNKARLAELLEASPMRLPNLNQYP